MRRYWIEVAILVGALAAASLWGNSRGHQGPDSKVVSIWATYLKATGVAQGTVIADAPEQAKLFPDRFSLNVPGKVEFPIGPSSYTITLDGVPAGTLFSVFVDSKLLKEDVDYTQECDSKVHNSGPHKCKIRLPLPTNSAGKAAAVKCSTYDKFKPNEH